MSIGPSDATVPVQLRVVAVPCRCAVVSLRIVMVAVTVSAHIEQLVLRATWSLAIKLGDLMFEPLPLSKVVLAMKSAIGWICAIDEAKICGHEVEGAGIGGGLILQEISCDCGIIDVGI